jgi:hypothetical protein
MCLRKWTIPGQNGRYVDRKLAEQKVFGGLRTERGTLSDKKLVRPVRFELTTFCSGGLWPPTWAFGFNAPSSAKTAKIGPLAAIWVGIWVGHAIAVQRHQLASREP